jgi:hypothetical protein
MKVMAKQVTIRVSTIKLPDGQCTQAGRETLKALFRVHFPDSRFIEDSDNGQGQQKQKEQGRLEPGQEYNQSKIRWVLGTFKPFQSVEKMILYRHSCSMPMLHI